MACGGGKASSNAWGFGRSGVVWSRAVTGVACMVVDGTAMHIVEKAGTCGACTRKFEKGGGAPLRGVASGARSMLMALCSMHRMQV